MARLPDKEFERLAVLHAMGALSPEETARFEAARAERGQGGERLVEGVERALVRRGGAGAAMPVERADLAAVTGSWPRSRPWAWIVLCLLFALAAAGGVLWALSERGRTDGLRAERDRAEGRADSLAAVAAAAESDAAGLPDPSTLAPLLAAAELTESPLTGATDARGRILAGPGGAILVARDLPALGEGAYRLWRMEPAPVEPVATLGDAPQGFLFAVFSDAAFLAPGGRWAITAEADADAPAPAGPILLEGRIDPFGP